MERAGFRIGKEQSALLGFYRGLEAAVALYAGAEAGERIGPVVLDAVGESRHVGLRVSARREILLQAIAVRLVSTRDAGGIVGSFGNQRVAHLDLHLRIGTLVERAGDVA